MRVHPVADLFPMMSEDELNDLAADIKANGQIHPIIITHEEADEGAEEILIDGRNRWRACEIAGVEPRFERLNGQDPVAYIMSSNDRRDMTQGQRAIVAAMTNSYKLYEFGAIENLGRALKVPRARVSEALVIVRHAPDLAEQVRKGVTPFHAALEQARKAKAASDDNADKMARLRKEAPDLADLAGISLDEAIKKLEARNADEAKLATIEADASDLVALVREGRMSVSDALAASDERKRQADNARQGATLLLADVVTTIGGLVDMADLPEQAGERLMKNFDQALFVSSRGEELTAARLTACAAMLAECSKQFKRHKGSAK